MRFAARTAAVRQKLMSLGRIEVEHQPGTYVSGTRARWLIQARRARLVNGKLQLPQGEGPGGRGDGRREPRTVWSAYSSAGAPNRARIRWLSGYHMNGDAVNHG